MASFQDANGKQYTLRLTFADVQQIKAVTGIDITKAFDPKSGETEKLFGDIYAFCNVLYMLCKSQHGGDEASFAETLDGDVLEAARGAVVAAVIDFFPSQPQRKTMTAIWKKSEDVTDALATEAIKAITETADQLITGASNGSLSISQALQAASLGTSPSAN
jgi:hypothetical protein